MWGGGGEVGVAGAPENTKVVVGRESAIESKEGSAHVQCLGWEAIDEESGCGKSISPVSGRHGCLEKQGAGDVVDSAKHALGFAILL